MKRLQIVFSILLATILLASCGNSIDKKVDALVKAYEQGNVFKAYRIANTIDAEKLTEQQLLRISEASTKCAGKVLGDVESIAKGIDELTTGSVTEAIESVVSDVLGADESAILDEADDVMERIDDLFEKIDDKYGDIDEDTVSSSKINSLIEAANAIGAACEKLEDAVSGKESSGTGRYSIAATGDIDNDYEKLGNLLEEISTKTDQISDSITEYKIKEGKAKAVKEAANALLAECRTLLNAF